MATSTLRSTKTLTAFVNLSDEAITLAKRLKEIKAEILKLTPDVLEQIGDSRSVMIGKQVRTLKPGFNESVHRLCDDATAVAYCKELGLDTHERSPEYVAPGAFTAYVKRGLIDSQLYEIEKTAIVVVT